MFHINIGTIDKHHYIDLSNDEIQTLPLDRQYTILQLIDYRHNTGFFPWGYNDLIKDLKLKYN